LINLLQEFENMSISEAGRKVGLSKSTTIRKVKQWNQMTSEIVEKGFPDSIATKVGKGRPAILKDEHTVFIFELLANEPTLTVEAVTDNLSK
jgi:transposase